MKAHALVRARLVAAAVALSAVLAAVTAGAPGTAARPAQGHAKVPHVVLNRGTLLGEPWHTTLFKAAPQSRRPCFGVTTQDSEIIDSFAECAYPRRGFVPLILSDSGDPDNRGIVVLLATPRKVHRVRLNFGGRADKTIWPKPVSRAKLRKAGVNPKFRYKAFARQGEFCLRRHVDYDAQGRVYYRSYRYPPCRRQEKEARSGSSKAGSSARWQDHGYVRALAG